ncbi:MAG: hypothetical protein ACP5H2_11045 [Solirubrobacteraceae bacterium]
MLFDLRSKRRRGTVRVIYLFLALVMVAGLVLVGVGTGTSGGGLLNAFTNGGSGGSQKTTITSQIKSALKQTEKNPNSATAWSGLLQARWAAAGTTGFDSTTGTYTAVGKEQLKLAAQDWTRYLQLSRDKPNVDAATLAARVYQFLSRWKQAAATWEYAALAQSGPAVNALDQYFCMSLNSYAAGNTTEGQLAQQKVSQLAPTLRKLELTTELTAAKGSATTAQQYVAQYC